MFSALAPRYDFGNHLLSANLDRLWRRRAARLGVGPDTRRVLDCCCGTGDQALACAREMAQGGMVGGCDFALPMLPIARRKIARARPSSAVAVLASDTLALPFADDSFDLVTISFGLRNLADREAGLREMARVVRPGGQVVVLEFTLPPNRLFRAVYRFYFERLLPWIARIGAGSKDYGYLPASVAEFPGPGRLKAMMESCGFHGVRYRLLTGGIAAIHIGRKPIASSRQDSFSLMREAKDAEKQGWTRSSGGMIHSLQEAWFAREQIG